jgi:hypothetical protein
MCPLGDGALICPRGDGVPSWRPRGDGVAVQDLGDDVDLHLVHIRVPAEAVMTARVSRVRGIPPNRETRSGRPFRWSLASKQVLSPSGVMALALWRAAILLTVDLCLAARGFFRPRHTPSTDGNTETRRWPPHQGGQ